MECYAWSWEDEVDVIITEWALQSYLDLVHSGTLTRPEYKQTIRPDVEKLKQYPSDGSFRNTNFWGPATDRSGKNIQDGYKMKWHNIGPGKVQLRLSVAVINNEAFLCRGYVKSSAAVDKREAAKLKDNIRDIHLRQFQRRGVLP